MRGSSGPVLLVHSLPHSSTLTSNFKSADPSPPRIIIPDVCRIKLGVYFLALNSVKSEDPSRRHATQNHCAAKRGVVRAAAIRE